MITRTQLKKELVAERKRMRVQQGESLFMRRSLSIFTSQRKRAAETKQELDYTLNDLRNLAKAGLIIGCLYCRGRLTAKKFCADHIVPVARGGKFTLGNLAICCPPCNFQKGMLDGVQFAELRVWIETHLAEPEKTDFKRRLTTGGRWTPK